MKDLSKHHSPTKLAVDLKTSSILMGFTQHADIIAKNYDEYVRGIYFPEYDKLYIRFWKRNGDYYFISEIDKKRSKFMADSAVRELRRQKYISSKTQILFWETDDEVTDSKIKW